MKARTYTAEMKILSILLVLLVSAAPLRAADLPDARSFSIAIERGDVSLARKWLDAGLSPDFEGNPIGTGLMIGAWEGNIAMMELFAARGADLDKANAFGEQALLHAAWKGRLDAVRWLVERGARLNRQGKEWAALHYAVFAGHADIAAYLLERGADVNALSVNGSTPLMMAAREGREAIAKKLLSAGARTDIVNERGDDALSWAMRNNNLRIAREISGHQRFAEVVKQPPAARGKPLRSQVAPDRVDLLLAQARRLEAAGKRDAALKAYRAALAAIRQADAAAGKAAVPARAVNGMVVTARRNQPGAQSASLSYATPAIENEPRKTAPADVVLGAAAAAGNNADGAKETADEWLQRAREFEAAGRRGDALQAYRRAAAVLRTATASPSR